MNLRILKKLSKRAAPLLPLLDEHRGQFLAEKGECYQHLGGHELKHWYRSRAKFPSRLVSEIQYRPKDGRDWIVMREPYHPLKGTPMVGSSVGYYEPEWEEETAWEALLHVVFNHFTTWDESGYTLLRQLDTPTKVFQAAQEIIEAPTAPWWEKHQPPVQSPNNLREDLV